MSDPKSTIGTSSQEKLQRLIGARVKKAREELRLSQEQVSKALGFKDRQILSNIESGKRKVSADELLKFIEVLKKSLEYFTDSFLLVGEACFSWRAKAKGHVLKEFEEKASRWIALYRKLGESLGETSNPLVPQLSLSKKSSFEESQEAAELLVKQWKLGDAPALKLPAKVEDNLDMLVLFVDAPTEISGAACKLPNLDVILVNRQEPDGRRSYDLAHELFHLLTWEKMPPAEIDPFDEGERSRDRVELLADNFAGALLMPKEQMEKLYRTRKNEDLTTWLNQAAESFGVSSRALFWRLKNLQIIPLEEQYKVNADRLSWNGKMPTDQERPRPFSKKFMRRLHRGLERGFISARKAGSLMGLNREEMFELFEHYELSAPYDL